MYATKYKIFGVEATLDKIKFNVTKIKSVTLEAWQVITSRDWYPIETFIDAGEQIWGFRASIDEFQTENVVFQRIMFKTTKHIPCF